MRHLQAGRSPGSTAGSRQGGGAAAIRDADGPQGAAAGERLRAAAAALASLPELGLARPLGVCAEVSALVTALPLVRRGLRARLL